MKRSVTNLLGACAMASVLASAMSAAVASPVAAQDPAAIEELLASWALPTGDIGAEDRAAAFRAHDLSTLLVPRTPFIGYRGDYDRLRVTFTEVVRESPDVYRVAGMAVHGARARRFTGQLRIVQVREVASMRLGAGEEFREEGYLASGISVGTYRLAEDPSVPGWGVYEGVHAVSWVQDAHGTLHRSDFVLRDFDTLRNNQFQGTWRAGGIEDPVAANWGEYRVPRAGDLDVGGANFSANPEYLSRGWRDLVDFTGSWLRAP